MSKDLARLMPRYLPAFLVTATLTTGPCRLALAQSMFRGDTVHSGVYDGSGNGEFGGLRWRVQTLGPVRSSPTVAGGVVYVGSSDGMVYALDAATGRTRWETAAGGAVTSSPAVAGGLVIAGTRAGDWLALDQRTGVARWRLRSGPEVPFPWGHESGDRYTASPTVAGQAVLLGGGDGVLRSVELSTGRVTWEARTAGRIRSSPAVGNGLVVVGDADGVVYGFDLATGKLRWKYETEGHTLVSARFGYDRRSIQSSPAIMDGRVFVGARDGYLYALDLATGQLRWRFNHEISWVNTSPAVEAGRVYAASSDGQFAQAVDAANGKELWRTKTGLVWASPAISGATVFFGDATGRLFALDKNSGAVRWSYRAGGAIFSSPTIAGGILYVGSDDGSIYAIDVSAPRALRRAVYWDSAFVRATTIPGHVAIRDWFRERDYEILDATGLARFMSERIRDRAPSTVVFASDHAPPTVAPVAADTVLLRRYLTFGGTIVCPGIPPLLWSRDPATGDRDLSNVNRRAPAVLLGVTFERGNFDPNGTSLVSDAGRRLGMVPGWLSAWAADPESVSEVLSTDEMGLASAWIRRLGQGSTGAFIGIPAIATGPGAVGNLLVLQTAAEAREDAR
ncbi:MAG: PQQ-binding-like beta-propeller repeat protein [Gemmatimonadetes bacterium]|nr:PQQ-binding-like beta-propeller repeat protein [Gemmatimonadota bacterium]